MASTTVSYSHTREGRAKQVSLSKQGKRCQRCSLYLEIWPTWALVKRVRALDWDWCSADNLSHVCQYPLAFPCLQPLQQYMVLFAYFLAVALTLTCWSQVPHHREKIQVSLVGYPGVVTFVGTCWGSWPILQSTHSCSKSRSFCLHPIAPTSFGFTEAIKGWDRLCWYTDLHTWGLMSGQTCPATNLAFRIDLLQRQSAVQWCPEEPQKHLPVKYLPVQVQEQGTTVSLSQRTSASGSVDGPLKPPPSTAVCVSQKAYSIAQRSLWAQAWGNHIVCIW